MAYVSKFKCNKDNKLYTGIIVETFKADDYFCIKTKYNIIGSIWMINVCFFFVRDIYNLKNNTLILYCQM